MKFFLFSFLVGKIWIFYFQVTIFNFQFPVFNERNYVLYYFFFLDDDELFLRNGWPSKGVTSYSQPGQLSDILAVANFVHARSRIWACAEPDLTLCWMKFCSSYYHYTTAPLYNFKYSLMSILGGAPTSICHFFLPSVRPSPTISQELTSSEHTFWYTCVKWWCLQVFFHFFLSFDFSGC